ncbi:hypothetical protein MKW92_019176, partial [Papaver armeniacum]
RKIRHETRLAVKDIGMSSSEDGFKGTFEYVDVIVSGNRYIVEVHLVGEFTIARPTNRYITLLEAFPQIFVGKPDKRGKKMTCTFHRGEGMDICKRNGLVCTRDGQFRSGYGCVRFGTGRRSVGFDTIPAPVMVYYCRDELERRRFWNG